MTTAHPTRGARLRLLRVGALAPLLLLALAAGPARADDAFEDNDTCAQAIAYSGGPGSLFVSDTDPDWFVVTAQPGARMVIDLQRTGGTGNPGLELLGSCGGAVLASSHRTGGTESVALNPTTIGPIGQYLLHVLMDQPGSCSYRLRISYQTPPDFDITARPVGWSAPIVPQLSLPTQFEELTVPPRLAWPLYFIFNIRTSATTPMQDRSWTIWVDDRVKVADDRGCPGCFPSGDEFEQVITGLIEGGRHTARVTVDPDNMKPEANELNNSQSVQWVWPPSPLTPGIPHHTYFFAPARGELSVANCDGFECVRGDAAWAVALAPDDPALTYGLSLYTDYVDSQTGFSDVAVAAQSPAARLKLLVGTRVSALVHFYPGVTNLGAIPISNGGYVLELDEASSTHSDQPAALWPDMTLGVNDPVDVFEGQFTAGATYHFSLTRGFGTADLTFALYPSASATAMPRADRMADGHATTADLDELDWTCPEDGWYPIVARRADDAAPLDAAGYSFGWTTTTSGVSDVPPSTPTLALRVLENPVRDRLRLELDLPAEAGSAQVAVYDVVGREIARLDAPALSKGPTHTLAWTPRADGRRLAAGTYFVRLTAGARSAVQRFELR